MKKIIEQCFLCGTTEDLTDDHIPPKNLYPAPRPSNLITVKSCVSCNKSYELDDEYLRTFLSSRPTRNPTAQSVWDEKVVQGTLRRSPALRQELIKTIRSTELKTPSGIYLGTLHTVGWDGKRLKREFEKIVRGLYFSERGSRLPHECCYEYFDVSDFKMGDFLLIQYASAAWKIIGQGEVFSYRYQIAQDNPLAGIWWLLFYQSTVVCCLHQEQAFASEVVQ